MKKNNKKGFTLAELLIVVAIIAVLVAIAIPIFSAQLEKSREATDLANVRAAYAEVVSQAIADGASTTSGVAVSVHQTKNNWQIASDASTTTIAAKIGDTSAVSVPAKTSGSYTVKLDKGKVTVE